VKRLRVGGAEQDAFSTHWRHLISWQPGERAGLKRKSNKRERREGKREAREAADE
jgi:hypothetical protein